jgi:uncharacterized protein (DUF924 family)
MACIRAGTRWLATCFGLQIKTDHGQHVSRCDNRILARNAVLSRGPTEEETAYLAQGSFAG